ncbi:Protein of unknown function [Klenkia soli]|uniref:DUF3180 domain-containing protein n=1 Tax=Klenkia soli TaxID=1052260 RepID=A0A1H0NHE3_9ACTN|nr:DUF3180 domain-containing protein [Klenkia soli]SDO92099.1 Protein of unknown function [Klenkia soli]
MRPVSRRDLAVVAVGLAVLGWVVVRALYGDLPSLHWWQPVPLALLAVAEGLGARSLLARLTDDRERRRAARTGESAALVPGQRSLDPVEPMLVARLAVLAQASAWAGAGFAGLWAGALVFTLTQVGRLSAASGDAVAAGIGVVCSSALVAGALLLERACRVPPED